MPTFKRNSGIIEEQILLGGKVSYTHPEYKDIAQNTANNQKIVWFLQKWEELINMSPIEASIMIFREFGKIDNFASFGEITRLSAILGDNRTRKSGKEIRNVINKKLHNL